MMSYFFCTGLVYSSHIECLFACQRPYPLGDKVLALLQVSEHERGEQQVRTPASLSYILSGYCGYPYRSPLVQTFI